MNKKICWVSADYFADTDTPIVPILSKKYDIHWIILFNAHGNRYKEEDFNGILKGLDNVTVEFIYNKHRNAKGLSPMLLAFDRKIKRAIRDANADVIYINAQRDSLFDLPLIWSLPKDKTIFTAHQGIVRQDMQFTRWTQFIRDLGYKDVKYVNMFSESEAEKLQARYPHVQITKIPLALKYFGRASNERPDRKTIRFLSFGLTVYAKHIDLLIDAANILYEKGYRNFKVSINGTGYDWKRCKEHIKYPEVIETDIRRIDNKEIPNLFNGSHYLVQPYRVVSQSGPMKIAFQYNLPDIVSNLPGLMCELKENVNGYSFKSEDANDLARVMEKCINQTDEEYQALLQRMKEYTVNTYSKDVLAKKYCDMFDNVIKNLRIKEL